MFNYHSLIPWGSFRGRQEEKWGSFRGWDHFGGCTELEKSKFVTRSETRGTEHQSILIPNKYENKNLILSRNRPGTFLCACFTACNLPNIWLFYIFSEARSSFCWYEKLNKSTLKIIFVVFPIALEDFRRHLFTSDHWQLVDTESCLTPVESYSTKQKMIAVVLSRFPVLYSSFFFSTTL